MLRERAQSHLLHSIHHKKQHCPEDISCRQCCPCVEVLKKQNKILLDKSLGWNKEKRDLEKYIAKLLKELKEWQRRKRQFQQIQQFKKKLRQEVRDDVLKQYKRDFMILKQKYDNAKLQKDRLRQQNDELKQEMQPKDRKFKQLEQKYRKLKQLYDEKCGQGKENDQSNNNPKYRLLELQNALRNKSDVIVRLERALKQAQKNYMQERGKSSSSQYQLLSTLQKLKEIKLHAEQKSASVQNLTKEKGELDKLVKELESTIHSYSILQGELKYRIIATEDYALQKDIQAKRLQADYYDCLHRRTL